MIELQRKVKEVEKSERSFFGLRPLTLLLSILLFILLPTIGTYLFFTSMGRGFPYHVIDPSASGTPKPYEGTKLDGGMAPDFRLGDQKGDTMALSDFRGRVIVLAFLDPECRDVCPLTAHHLRKAYQLLYREPDSVLFLFRKEPDPVVFLGVNVNAKAGTVADMANATEKWRLAEVPTWHFLTGSPEALKSVWKAYAIAVEPSPETEGELLHTSGIYLIDQAGRKRWYLSTPLGEETAWGAPELSELLSERIRQLLKAAEWGLPL